VKEWREVEGRAAGDLIAATLVVAGEDAYLADVRKTGAAPVEAPPPAPTATSGFELLKPGEPVPDHEFVDERSRTRRLSELHGRAVAITFIYTRCPVPTFCPLMDRNFAGIQARIKKDRRLTERVHLVSVSFDPAYDTPDVLRQHAATLGADPALWSFFTGERDGIDRFAARFGVSITREGTTAAEITHNLRTVVIDAAGRVAKVYTGLDWDPAQVFADLAALAPR
jgi:protein SCO1